MGDDGRAAVIALLLGSALALPLYAQRSGRTCGNCHVSPTLEDPDGWENPELMERKCTMTCLSCHVDPTGGGLRNASGRYFGGSTLGMVGSRERSYSDVDRDLLTPGVIWTWRVKLSNPPKGEVDGRTVPSDRAEVEAGVGQGQTGNTYAMGRHRKTTDMAFWDGRYGSLAADPVVQVGGDVRFAWYSGTGAFFPMQLDLHGAVHPVHHLTVAATAAGRQTGPTGPSSPVYMRRAYAMLHELPGMSWVRAGAFQPAFGTLLDDHTAAVRTLFEMDGSKSVNTVTGVEVGTAPNYPFASVSVFANDASWAGSDPDTGWGAAAQAGWRDLAWSLTGHAMVRRRQRLGQGDLLAAGIGWGLSPRQTWEGVPVTWLGEVSAGRRDVGDRTSYPAAAMSELSFLLRNGIVLKSRSDVWTEDLASIQQRHGLALQVTPLPGITLEATGRMLVTPKGTLRPDALLQTHLWF
ncbi:MAG: hypothetical protein H6736_09545 [Alphaproteobacteria bacterium]|nr:hypothetical protein [Alphaproteobacteria bacterium]